MYKIRLSTLRKYTFAALNGLGEVTVPDTVANPDKSVCLPAEACPTAVFSGKIIPKTASRSTIKLWDINVFPVEFFVFMSKSPNQSSICRACGNSPTSKSSSRNLSVPTRTIQMKEDNRKRGLIYSD